MSAALDGGTQVCVFILSWAVLEALVPSIPSAILGQQLRYWQCRLLHCQRAWNGTLTEDV
jgi:hypothetical protein